MRFNLSGPTLFALSSLILQSTALPFALPQFIHAGAIIKRGSYSVVAVDGGGSPGSPATSTIHDTIVQTEQASTKTIIETDVTTLPPSTNVIVSTKTVEGSDTTKVIEVTVTPPASQVTVTATGYSIVDVASPDAPPPSPPFTTSATTATVSASSSSSASASSKTTSSSVDMSSTSSTRKTSSQPPQASSSTIYTTFPTITSSLQIYSQVPAATLPSPEDQNSGTAPTALQTTTSSTELPYDNGQWHTIYPVWSKSTATGVATLKARQTGSSGVLSSTSRPRNH